MKPGLASSMETNKPFGITSQSNSLTKQLFEQDLLRDVAVRERQPRDRIRILLVEQRVPFAQRLAKVITRWGNACDIAYSSAAALQIAAWHQPQVIMIQLDRPSRDAAKLARRLKADLKGYDTLFIGYTKLRSQESWRNKHHSPFDLILSKPLRLSVLNTILLLERAHQAKLALIECVV
jgi:CheY-like chemotaxis protein